MPDVFVDLENGSPQAAGTSYVAGGGFLATFVGDITGANTITRVSGAALDAAWAGTQRVFVVNAGASVGDYDITAVNVGAGTVTIAAISGGTAVANGTGRTCNVGGAFKEYKASSVENLSPANVIATDHIKVIASRNPTNSGVNATFTQGTAAAPNRTVTLSAALTKVVYNCEAIWTNGTNGTSSLVTAARKQGANAAQVVIAAGATTNELLAYRALGSAVDFSGYQQLTLWFRTSVATTAGMLKVCLCSDSAGATPVDSFAIPAMQGALSWCCFTIDKGSALGASIQSVALYSDTVDPGSIFVTMDCIHACKAPTDAGCLTLSTLIGKANSMFAGGNDSANWFPVKNISDDGLTLEIDNEPASLPGAGRGYYGPGSGSAEALWLWTPTRLPTLGTSVASVALALPDPGTAQARTKMTGGWSRTDATSQNGYTLVDCVNGFSAVFLSQPYTEANRIGVVRGGSGISATGQRSLIDIPLSVGCSASGVIMSSGTGSFSNITVRMVVNSAGRNIQNQSSHNVVVVGRLIGSALGGIYDGGPENSYVALSADSCIANCGTYAIEPDASSLNSNVFGPLKCELNSFGTLSLVALFNTRPLMRLSDVSMLDVSETVNSVSTLSDPIFFSENHDASAGNHKIIGNYFTAINDTSVKDSGTQSWKLTMNGSLTTRGVLCPIDIPILLALPVKANRQVTVTARFRRDNTGIETGLAMQAGQIAGYTLAEPTPALMTAAVDTWQTVTFQFTPTEDGVVDVVWRTYVTTTNNSSVWIDNVTIADTATYDEMRDLDIDYRGGPFVNFAGAGSGGGGAIINVGMDGGME